MQPRNRLPTRAAILAGFSLSTPVRFQTGLQELGPTLERRWDPPPDRNDTMPIM